MNKWQEVVKRVSKAHPGKSLKQILPIAKAKYRKMERRKKNLEIRKYKRMKKKLRRENGSSK